MYTNTKFIHISSINILPMCFYIYLSCKILSGVTKTTLWYICTKKRKNERHFATVFSIKYPEIHKDFILGRRCVHREEEEDLYSLSLFLFLHRRNFLYFHFFFFFSFFLSSRSILTRSRALNPPLSPFLFYVLFFFFFPSCSQPVSASFDYLVLDDNE